MGMVSKVWPGPGYPRFGAAQYAAGAFSTGHVPAQRLPPAVGGGGLSRGERVHLIPAGLALRRGDAASGKAAQLLNAVHHPIPAEVALSWASSTSWGLARDLLPCGIGLHGAGAGIAFHCACATVLAPRAR